MSANPHSVTQGTPGDLGVSPLDDHNKKLVENVHPSSWANPVAPKGRYNMVVIGAGTAGLVTANGAAGMGAKVALIERHLMGGDCLNVGCVPSKALIRAAHAIADARDAGEFGVRVKGYEVDFPAIMERMRKLRAKISHADSAHRYKSLGIDVYIGDAKFTGRDTVEVGGQTLRFKRACIASGARAFVPPVPGLREAGFLTNESIFNLTELPKRMVAIGAGPIGCEMAQSFARFGTQVHLLEPSDHIMSREDRDAAEIVQAQMLRDGVKIHSNMKVEKVEVRGGDKIVTIDQAGKKTEIACDVILVGAGRAPNVEGMGLDKAEVKFDTRNGVEVDDHLMTSNKAIYAAGDVASKFKFTHAADFLARTVIENALFKSGIMSVLGRRKASALTIPWCTYTDPEVAHVGWYEPELKKAGIPFRTFVQSFEEVDRAILDGEQHGFVKVTLEEKTDKILGATIVAKHAGDMINEFTLAIVNGIGMGKIARTIHPYPTQAEAIRKAGDLFNRTKLTPKAKALTTRLMKWQRGGD